ncbi:hypothetical protein CEXT_5311 [Caerostris extrusa]|uniref:Uncharacterized protein n=1 Tax=Caerostris extrusa TaxID=172846 RepID=A0AAV4S0Q2_CAEEX|nr:hypothetical protein CEXT_5311 [Caerostris extrusa]
MLDGVLGRNGINNGYQNVVVRTDRCDKSAGNQAISSLPIHDGAIVNKKGAFGRALMNLGVIELSVPISTTLNERRFSWNPNSLGRKGL